MGSVLLTDHAWPDAALEREILEAAGHRLVTGPAVAGTEPEIEALVERHEPEAIMTCWAPVSARSIALPPRLRIVARLGVGLDNIAVSAATARKAWVTNVPDYCVEEVSDHALALVLAWTRGIVAFDRRVKSGSWDSRAPIPLRRSSTLTVGILGLGRIGRLTARKLAAFGITVLGCDVRPPEAPSFVALVDAETLAHRSDIVIVHLPLTSGTHHFVGRDFLSGMKPGSLLVNVSRGPVVDSDALLDALATGRIGAAALDVVEGEPRPPAALVERPDVIATPHVAFASDAAVVELRRRATEEVVRVLAGNAPHHPVNTIFEC